MSAKYDLAAYLASLTLILQSQGALGRQPSQWLTEEYDRVWDKFQGTVEKEKEDEARRSVGDDVRTEDRAEESRDLSGRGESVGEPYRPQPSLRPAERR